VPVHGPAFRSLDPQQRADLLVCTITLVTPIRRDSTGGL
jgi:hypothetical protein